MQLTQKQLVKACCRAIYLWEFGDDAVDVSVRKSDKALLQYFGGAWNDYKNSGKPINYIIDEIINLIKNCGVRTSQEANPQLPSISRYLNDPQTLVKHDYVLATPIRLRTRWEFGKNCTNDLAELLNVSKVTGQFTRGAGDQKALASRVLFFAMPEIHCYNYSQPLIDKLEKQCSLQNDTVDGVCEKMNELFLLHETELKNLPRPKFDDLNRLETAINAGDWWERRVLDLAILENWECFCQK